MAVLARCALGQPAAGTHGDWAGAGVDARRRPSYCAAPAGPCAVHRDDGAGRAAAGVDLAGRTRASSCRQRLADGRGGARRDPPAACTSAATASAALVAAVPSQPAPGDAGVSGGAGRVHRQSAGQHPATAPGRLQRRAHRRTDAAVGAGLGHRDYRQQAPAGSIRPGRSAACRHVPAGQWPAGDGAVATAGICAGRAAVRADGCRRQPVQQHRADAGLPWGRGRSAGRCQCALEPQPPAQLLPGHRRARAAAGTGHAMAAGPRHRRGAGSGRRTDPAADAAVASAEAAFSSTLWKLMMDTTAEHEIHRLHDKLQAWFRAEACIDALDDLMAHFCSDFSMVGIAGRRLDRHAVQALFAGTHGARAGLKITIEAVQALEVPSPLAVLRYREGHAIDGGEPAWRESLAVLRQEQGRWCWLALHEVAV
ncbi:hypothetical protein G6F65_015643 [Rhizopus arrhizus]|nr:hypothetical protein G6F65_015643 [Rhizopus arrhizus]